jgi:hypothetical protein
MYFVAPPKQLGPRRGRCRRPGRSGTAGGLRGAVSDFRGETVVGSNVLSSTYFFLQLVYQVKFWGRIKLHREKESRSMHETPSQRARFDELASEIDDSDGVLTVLAERPKAAWGGKRLGSNIRDYITDALEVRGIGHIPQEFPSGETIPVRLYRRDSSVGKLIAAVLNPGEDTDQELREQVGATSPIDDAKERVAQVRQLIGEIIDILDEP